MSKDCDLWEHVFGMFIFFYMYFSSELTVLNNPKSQLSEVQIQMNIKKK